MQPKRMKKQWMIVFVVVVIVYFIWQNNDIVTTHHVYANNQIPDDFDQFKIVQISDLHNKSFGTAQARLLAKIEGLHPNLILITGDLIDRRDFDLETAMILIRGATQIAPVYFASGNHEAWSGRYVEIRNALVEAGVVVLDNAAEKLKIGNASITLYGLLDPDFLSDDYRDGTNTSKMERSLEEWRGDDSFRILLSHRPELFDIYQETGMDLIFSGHAHGGQVRLPFLGGIVAPDQGLFPKYTSGRYDKGSATMYVSRGLGNSLFPLRIFNRPELVVVTLKVT